MLVSYIRSHKLLVLNLTIYQYGYYPVGLTIFVPYSFLKNKCCPDCWSIHDTLINLMFNVDMSVLLVLNDFRYINRYWQCDVIALWHHRSIKILKPISFPGSFLPRKRKEPGNEVEKRLKALETNAHAGRSSVQYQTASKQTILLIDTF